MALWKPLSGNRLDLNSVEKHEGYVYFCIDDGTLFFDYLDKDGILQRKQINAKDAETLLGVSLDEIKNDATDKALVALAEAQKYTDNAIANIDMPTEAIVDVEELPNESINDKAIYRVETSAVECEDIYVFTDGLDAPVTISDMFKLVDPSLEAIVKIHTVDELPGELLPMDAATYTMHIYVVRDTGIGYINATYEGNDEAPSRAPMSVYMDDYANLSRGPDRGWVDGVEDITKYGVYALRRNVVDYTYYVHKNGIWTLLVGVNTTTKTLPNDFWEAFEAGMTIGGKY